MLPGAESLDDSAVLAPSVEIQRADYLLFQRSMIVEVKELETDPAFKVEAVVDRYRSHPSYPLFFGQRTLQAVLEHMPAELQEEIRQGVYETITTSIMKGCARANGQIRDTRAHFGLARAAGVVFILTIAYLFSRLTFSGNASTSRCTSVCRMVQQPTYLQNEPAAGRSQRPLVRQDTALSSNARRRRWRGWARWHITAMGSSYVLLLTAFYVDNGRQLPLWRELPAWTYWTLPALVGTPIIVWTFLRHRVVRDSSAPR